MKKGDIVKVYGNVNVNMNNEYMGECHYFSKGVKAEVTFCHGDGELEVKIYGDKAVPQRNLNGRYVIVHSKQCRKLVKKNLIK